MQNLQSVKTQLDKYVDKFNTLEFINSDPILIPHRFSCREDIEISGFLSATIAWGQRKSIIKNALRLMDLMDNAPRDFLLNANENTDWQSITSFVHRTFNSDDCRFFLRSLKNIYLTHSGLENVFVRGYEKSGTIYGALKHFRTVFLELPHARRAEKHLSDVTKNSAAKRLNMFLRWMVRADTAGVDFGIWQQIPASALMLPLDVHSGNVGRAFGLLTRQQNDWKAVEEITGILRTFDPEDPIKYDFALFGIGVSREIL
jgi:uncharacterized protein (TIGR02757 family)